MKKRIPFTEEITRNYAPAPVRELNIKNRKYNIRRLTVEITEENVQKNINEIKTDPQRIAMGGYSYRDGFVFVSGQTYPTVYNRLVIRSPLRARSNETRLGYSNKSLES